MSKPVTIDEILLILAQQTSLIPRGKTVSVDNTKCLVDAKLAINKMVNEKQTELLDSLYLMYIQYCANGHLFMGAGETASELLENAGYITTNGAGRVVKDNGDSNEQLTAHQYGLKEKK